VAASGAADLMISGDRDLLELVGRTAFGIETPAAYRNTVLGDVGRV
jgi:predicted nucleic acid-binding protein